MPCASAREYRRVLRCFSLARSSTFSSVLARLRSIGFGLWYGLNEFAEFELYPWVPKRAAFKLNSAFNATSTAASKEVGEPGILPFEPRQY